MQSETVRAIIKNLNRWEACRRLYVRMLEICWRLGNTLICRSPCLECVGVHDACLVCTQVWALRYLVYYLGWSKFNSLTWSQRQMLHKQVCPEHWKHVASQTLSKSWAFEEQFQRKKQPKRISPPLDPPRLVPRPPPSVSGQAAPSWGTASMIPLK